MASSTGGSSEELPARLDTLLSSAIRERARDERALADVFGGMKQDMEAFGKELASIRKLVQRPFEPVLSLLDSKLAEVADLVSDLRNQLFHRLQSTGEQQSDRLAQESKTLGKFVEDWSRYLDARVQEESVAIRKLLEGGAKSVETRLGEEAEEIKGLLGASRDKSAKDLERHMKAAAKGAGEMTEHLGSQLGQAEEALRADLEAAQEALLEGIEETSETVSETLHEIISVVQNQISESLAEGLKPFAKEVRALADRIDEAGRGIAESNTRLEAVQTSLVGYLRERDEHLERVRDQVLIDLADKMADALKGKAKTKIVDALREGDKRRKDERDAARYRDLGEGKPADAKAPADWPKDWIGEQADSNDRPWLSDSK